MDGVDIAPEIAVQKPESLSEKSNSVKQIESHLQEKYGSSTDLKTKSTLEFFLHARDSDSPSPIESIDSIYKGLENVPEEIVVRSMTEDVDLAFAQHLDNPEHYVSHGFDHTLNVLGYTRSIHERNPKLIDIVSEKYGISPGESRFVIELVSLYHDFGYPVAEGQGLAKVNHAIAGAEIVIRKNLEGLVKNVTPELRSDIRDAILFHGSDKIEGYFDSKIKINKGEFLVDSKNIVTVLSHFMKEQNAVENILLHVPDEETKTTLIQSLQQLGVDMDRIQFVDSQFAGRYADLATKKDKMLGLEFSEVDVEQQPLFGIIRAADNMDIAPSRLSPLQRLPGFQEIYKRMGDRTLPDAQIYKMLQSMPEVTVMTAEIADMLNKSVEAEQLPFDETTLKSKIADFEAFLSGTYTESPLLEKFKEHVVQSTLAKYPELELNTRARLEEVGRKLAYTDFWHFGGSEAVKSIVLDGSVLQVQVDKAKFDQLSNTFAEETISGQNVAIPVGEYQIWRMAAAYRGIRMGDQAFTIVVQTLDPDGIVTNQRIFNR